MIRHSDDWGVSAPGGLAPDLMVVNGLPVGIRIRPLIAPLGEAGKDRDQRISAFGEQVLVADGTGLIGLRLHLSPHICCHCHCHCRLTALKATATVVLTVFFSRLQDEHAKALARREFAASL